MPEEFRVNQVWRDSTTVDADEGAGGARGTGVDSTGDDFFTRAGLPQQEHGHIGVTDQFDALHHRTQAPVGTNNGICQLGASQTSEQRLLISFSGLPEGGEFTESAIIFQRHSKRLQEFLEDLRMEGCKTLPGGCKQEYQSIGAVFARQRANQEVALY